MRHLYHLPRSDMTYAVDWALKTNHLFLVPHTTVNMYKKQLEEMDSNSTSPISFRKSAKGVVREGGLYGWLTLYFSSENERGKAGVLGTPR